MEINFQQLQCNENRISPSIILHFSAHRQLIASVTVAETDGTEIKCHKLFKVK